jgi:hypothetical protein
MACLESVIFGLLGKSIRVQRLYDRSRLRLGSLVYVRPSAQEDGTEFSPEWSDGSIPYWVRWIATSEWYVELIPRFELRAEFAERVHKEVEGYLSRTEVNDAIAKFVGLVRMERFYQTSELGGNPLSVVFTVIDRLEVCRRLRQSPPFPVEFFKTALDDPLVTYLYLTCFDLARSACRLVGLRCLDGIIKAQSGARCDTPTSAITRFGGWDSFRPSRIQFVIRSPLLIFPVFAWPASGFT